MSEMSEAPGSASEWELSKENIQPLRQGRKFASLSAALKPHDGDEWSKIKEEKQLFEEELRTYSGDDPLDVWHRYIVWTEQTYLKGGKDGSLSVLLEKCLAQFQKVEKYKNDERYIDCWIKYANCCIEPQTIFVFMYDQNIGSQWACFYESWAWHLEQLGNFQRANSILQEGISREAHPLERLKRNYGEFQMRVARVMVSSEVPDTFEEVEVQRSALGHLKTTGKRSHVSSDRVNSLKAASQGGLGTKGKPLHQQRGQMFQVFNDENQAPVHSLPPQTGEWQSLPQRSVINKENDQKPGAWTKARVPQKSGVVPFHAVGGQSQPTFSVLEEDNPDLHIFTPRKVGDIGSQVLSARKPGKQLDPLLHVRMAVPNNSEPQPMYCKEKIYAGTGEFSFEELRAARWRKKMEMQVLETEQKEMKRLREELEQQKKMISEQSEMIKRQREQLQLDHEKMILEYQQQSQIRQIELDRKNNSQIQQQQEVLERSIDSHLQQQINSQTSFQVMQDTPSSNLNRDSSNVKKSLFEMNPLGESSVDGFLKKQPTATVKVKQDAAVTAGSEPRATDPNSSNKTPVQKGCSNEPLSSERSRRSNGPTPENTRRINMADPSPTVNTKEAMNLVAGMFFPLDNIDQQYGWDDDDSTQTDQVLQVQPGKSEPLQFTVFDDMQGVEQSNQKKIVDKNRLPLQQKVLSEPAVNAMETNPTHLPENRHTNKMEVDDDDKMDGVESEARDDLTIGPVGSHLSFAASAHFASTPFHPSNPALSKGKDQSGNADNQKSESPKFPDKVPPTGGASADGSLSRKDLSPIMEGSNEESNSHGSTMGGSHAGTGFRSVVSHAAHSMQSVSEHCEPQTLFTDLSPEIRQPPQMEMDMLKVAGMDMNRSAHNIDTSTYVPEEVENDPLSMSVYINPSDPFDEETINQFLRTLSEPLDTYPNYISVSEEVPCINEGHILYLGPDVFTIQKKIGKGGFAEVFSVQGLSIDDTFTETAENQALKIQKPASRWEFYICSEIQRRLCRMNTTIDMRSSVMSVTKGYFFSNGSCLVSNFCPNGTLLDFVNRTAREGIVTDREPLCAYLTIELIRIVEHLHKCHIIHGDIKPDNFLVMEFNKLVPSKDPDVVFGDARSLQLIDFGQSIDMTKYSPGTTFMAKVKTDGFQCVEMKTNRPWTYQTDLFSLLGTVHVLACNQYMNIYCSNNRWTITKTFPRKWNVDLWKDLFNSLLNIPNCEEIPDLAQIRQKFEDYFIQNLLQRYNQLCIN